jgi:hypothetical protein
LFEDLVGVGSKGGRSGEETNEGIDFWLRRWGVGRLIDEDEFEVLIGGFGG